MIDNKVVGNAIAKLRQAEGMTQQTLAACLNVSHQAVSKWEKGAALPDVLTLVELSRMFGVTLEQLLSGDVDFRLEGHEKPAERPIELKLDYTDIGAKVEKAVEDAMAAAEETIEESEYAACEEAAETIEDAFYSSTEPEKNAESNTKVDLDEISKMAPFMSRKALEEIVMRYNGKCNPKQLSRLAPFLSKDCLEKLVVNCESDITWDTMRRLAPFLRKEFVDAFATAAAKGEKYTGDLGKQIKHGIKKVYSFGDQIYHDAIKPAIKKVIDAEKPHRSARKAAPAPEAPVNRVSAARARIFERALNEEKFDWIGEHIDQLDDENLKAKIAARALELGMNEWLDSYMDDYCDQNAMDNAILSGNWEYVAAHLDNANEDALALIADTAAAEGKWDWISENIAVIAGCEDARAAVIGHALKADNLEWLGNNLCELEINDSDSQVIVAYVTEHEDWQWLEAHWDELEGSWACAAYAEAAYKAGYTALATTIIENSESPDLFALIMYAVVAGDAEYAMSIVEYNAGDNGALCIALANNRHLKEAIDIAEEYGAESDTVAALLDIAAGQDNWEYIDRLNDLLA